MAPFLLGVWQRYGDAFFGVRLLRRLVVDVRVAGHGDCVVKIACWPIDTTFAVI